MPEPGGGEIDEEPVAVDQTFITPGLDYDSDKGNVERKTRGNSEAAPTGLS